MKRRGLFLVTLLTLVFSGMSMARAGWFHARPSNRAAQCRGQSKALDPMNSQAAWRYRHGQASNWRSVMLYR